MANLEEAISIAREAVDAIPEDHPYERAGWLNNLGVYLGVRYSRTGAMADLEEAISIAREAVKATPEDHLDERAGRLNNLGNRLSDRYSRTGALKDLDEAISTSRESIKATPEDHPRRPMWLSNLGVHLGTRHSRTGAMEDLKEAIAVAREAVKATPEDNPEELAGHLTSLGNRLSSRYSRTGRLADLNEAIAIIQQAVKATPEDHPDRARRLSSLGNRLSERYSCTGSIVDLKESITTAQEALKVTPEDHPDRAARLSNLGLRFSDRYLRTGAAEDLEEAIAVARQAVKATSGDYLGQAICLNNLQLQLGNRYLRTGAIADIEEAITVARQAVNALPEDYPDRPIWLNNLQLRLSNRYSRTGAIEDLEEAICIAREAVKATPEGHVDRATWLNNLGNRLSDRYKHAGEVKDLEEAVEFARKAVAATPEDHPDRAAWLNNLGNRLSERHAHNRAITDLEESIDLAQEAVKTTPEGHPDRAGWLNNLAIRLGDRYSSTGAMEDIEGARSRFKEAFEAKEAKISDRFRGGRGLLWSLDALKDIHDMYPVAEAAVNLIPLLSSFSLQSADKQHQLRQAVGLASDAAALALHVGKGPLAALQLLETGRGVLAGSLQNIRTDLSALQQEFPELAGAFVHLRDQLDAPAQQTSLEPTQLISPTKMSPVDPDSRHKASLAIDSLLGDIRSRPGFERFLASATEEEMREATVHGPVVVINVSSYRCDALFVERSGVRFLALPELTLDGLKARANSLESVATLAWLWDVVVGPVLDALGVTGPPSGDTWPHVWWVPTGPLTRFPLHAAGHHSKRSAETALDRVVSSYSPSIKSILHTRRQRRLDAGAASGPNVVLVDMQETPGQNWLSHAKRETRAVQQVCEAIGLPCNQPLANKKDVLIALETCKILHFAGHGGAHSDPLRSLLLLKDWEKDPLTVESLLETNSSASAQFLAYLSACGTGRIQDDRSIDESIHLASAFQLAGFRHVIGTLWEVDDGLCVDMARLTYKFLGANGLSDESVSSGLHYATKTLRDRWVERQAGTEATERASNGNRDMVLRVNAKPDRPLWVPYVHFGV